MGKVEILNNLKESHDEAIKLCNEAIRIADKTPIFHYIQARGLIWIHKADAHFFKKEYDLALKSIKIAIYLMPDSPIVLFCQGFYLMGIKAYNETLESFEKASFLREIKEGRPLAVDFELKIV